MNILFLSTKSPYPLVNGHSLRTYHILKGAAEQHRVTLVTFVQQPEYELKKESIEHLESFCHEVHQFRIPFDVSRKKLALGLFLNLFSSAPFVAKKYDSPEMRSRIREIMRKERIDLVHADMLPLAVYTDEFPSLPRVLVNHNVESVRLYRWYKTEKNILKKLYLGLQWMKLRRFERSAVRKFDSCVVVSEIDRDELVKLSPGGNYSVISNGTDTNFFSPGSEGQVRNSVLWLGHMDVHTNRDAVLYFWRDICPVLRKRLPDISITFVGTAPPQEIARAAETDSRITVTGFVDDIRPHVRKAQVVAVPIRIGSGTRLKILDAMAMGKAIVSTSVGCEGLDVEDNVNIMISDSPEEFSERVIQLMESEELRQRIEENARQLSKTYDWSNLCKLQEEVYRQVAAGRLQGNHKEKADVHGAAIKA